MSLISGLESKEKKLIFIDYRNWVFWLIIVAIVVFVIILAIYISLEAALAFLAIAISLYLSVKSIKYANESLKLTRDTIRPFINVCEEVEKPQIIIEAPDKSRVIFPLQNSGVSPADSVNISCFLLTGEQKKIK